LKSKFEYKKKSCIDNFYVTEYKNKSIINLKKIYKKSIIKNRYFIFIEYLLEIYFKKILGLYIIIHKVIINIIIKTLILL
jgi:hypothetical protein